MTTKPTTTATEGEQQKNKRFLLTKQQICTSITLFCTSWHTCDMKLPNFTRSPYEVAEQKSCLFPLQKLDTVLSDSTRENFVNICQIKWNWIRSMKFEAVWILFSSDVFGLLSSKNFAFMATLRNDFSFLLQGCTIVQVLLRGSWPWNLYIVSVMFTDFVRSFTCW